jgi:cytochrome c oxidase subunit II
MSGRRPPRASVALGTLAVLLLLVAAGCGGNQNVVRPESQPERRITTLWWVMMGGAWVGFGVIVFLLYLGWRRRKRTGLPGGADRGGSTAVVLLGVAVPIVVLTLLFVYADVFVIGSTAAPNPRTTARTIEVIGNQWFWAVRYPGTRAVTANEIHIPVGTPINVVGRTNDVIHSFWVPRLNRKIDLIPGRTNRVLLEADAPGVYRGQCSEFCGFQHAHMALYVFADPPARFRSWLANMAKPARRPATAAERSGQRIFLSEPCAACHTIRGTPAGGKVGPDLTHLRTRTTLAALTIPNREGYLSAWIRDPQHFKPGNKMPGLSLTGSQFRDLVAYLQSLR